jgi:hypothetical protein
MRYKSSIFWALAILITLGSAIYQRRTGPTHPYRGEVVLGSENISYRLIRSYHRPADAPVKVEASDKSIEGHYRFKRYPSHDDWSTAPMVREGDHLLAFIPQQPAAGKVMYQITLTRNGHETTLSEEPIIIRFRNDVPAWALIPHVIIMFLAMMFSTRAGLAALFGDRTFRLTLLTFVSLLLGGMIFGPLVQKFAFGQYWTGWPLGTDLTDNKTAVAFLVWIVALFKTWRNPDHRLWVIVASIVLMLVYLIPHSLLGSEIDWTEQDKLQQTGIGMHVICFPVCLSFLRKNGDKSIQKL